MSDTRENVNDAIRGALSAESEIVTKWIACVETIDVDGARALWMFSNEDARPWDNLGLLAYATQFEQARATNRFEEEEEDDA